MRDAFFWAAIVSFCAGIAVASLVPIGWMFVWLGLVLAGAMCLLASLLANPKQVFVGVLILLIFSAGSARMLLVQELLYDPVLDSAVGETMTVEGFVQKEPDVRERSVRLNVHADRLIIGEEEFEVDAGILAVVRLPFDFAYGDRVRVEGELSLPESFETDTGRMFDYASFLAKEGIAYEVPFPEVDIIEPANWSAWGSLYALKQTYIYGLAQSLPEPHSALAGGITVGDKRSLGDDLLEQFRVTGIIHIVVLSGYNLTIISENILRLFSRAPQLLGFGAGGIAIVLFTIMTGASASIVRASVMALLAMLARATRRRYAITRALALAAAGMVLWDPHVLLYDPGFQLSVLATIGLIYVAPLIESRVPWVPERFGLRAIVGATLGTQLFVLPLLLYQTGFVSLVALPVNLLVLIIMPYAMFFSLVASIAGVTLGSLAVPFAAPAYLLLSYTLAVTERFGSLPIAGFSIGAFPIAFVIAAYAVLGAWIWRQTAQEAIDDMKKEDGRGSIAAAESGVHA